MYSCKEAEKAFKEMNDRLTFLLKENLPVPGVRIDQNAVVANVISDAQCMNVSVSAREVRHLLRSFNNQQYLVLFEDGTLAVTVYGENSLK